MSIETLEKRTTSVTIFDKEYLITGPSEEEEALIAAAKLLDRRMREICDSGKVTGLERITVMAALYIAHEMITSKRPTSADSSKTETENQIQSMLELLDSALEESPIINT